MSQASLFATSRRLQQLITALHSCQQYGNKVFESWDGIQIRIYPKSCQLTIFTHSQLICKMLCEHICMHFGQVIGRATN